MAEGMSFHAISKPPKQSRALKVRQAVTRDRALADGRGTTRGRSGSLSDYQPVASRPSPAERNTALEFFDAVLALMRSRRKDELVLKDIKLAIGIKLGHGHCDVVYDALRVAGLELVPVHVSGGYGGSCYGLARDQIERAVSRLRPVGPNLYRGDWS